MSEVEDIKALAAEVAAKAADLGAQITAWEGRSFLVLPTGWYDATDGAPVEAQSSPPAPPPPPAPDDYGFDHGNAVLLTPTSDVAAVVASHPAGTHFRFMAGHYANAEDIKARAGDHYRGPEEGNGYAYLAGGGKGYCFRAADGAADDVKIGRLTIADYGVQETRQDYAAIMAKAVDVIAGHYGNDLCDRWTLYDLTLARNGPSGVHLSNYATLKRVSARGHSVTGVNGDRFVGGLIEDCVLEANALNPATGVSSNGANLKATWVNAKEGRTDITPTDSPVERLVIRNLTSRATHPDITGTCRIGLWMDLDCFDVEVDGGTFHDHPATSIFYEGCNNGWVHGSKIYNSDGYGPAWNKDFANAGLCFGESTNMLAEDVEIHDSDYAVMNRLSRRTGDWYNNNNASYVNYADPNGSRYWLGHTETIPAVGGRSNIWTGKNTYRRIKLVNCNKVVINEGTNGTHSGYHQTTHGKTPLSTIRFEDGDYAQSPNVRFYHASNTSLTLAQWQALPYTRDQ